MFSFHLQWSFTYILSSFTGIRRKCHKQDDLIISSVLRECQYRRKTVLRQPYINCVGSDKKSLEDQHEIWHDWQTSKSPSVFRNLIQDKINFRSILSQKGFNIWSKCNIYCFNQPFYEIYNPSVLTMTSIF